MIRKVTRWGDLVQIEGEKGGEETRGSVRTAAGGLDEVSLKNTTEKRSLGGGCLDTERWVRSAGEVFCAPLTRGKTGTGKKGAPPRKSPGITVGEVVW